MTRDPSRSLFTGSRLAILLGAAGGLILVFLAQSPSNLLGSKTDRSGRLAILINGLSPRVSRDLFLPTRGWVLSLELPENPSDDWRERLSVTLRAARTGATIQIEDRFELVDGFVTLTIPEDLGLFDGLLSIRAIWTDASGGRFEDWRRVRVRPWLGGPAIGSRQVVHFDFEVDRDGDGRPDFHQDLEAFGLASPDRPDLARIVADRIAARALARVDLAYDDPLDPNRTGRAKDPVTVDFRLEAEPAPYVTRICVGGDDPTHSDSVGHVRFDRANSDRSSIECGDDPVAGLFPRALTVYRQDELFRETFGPFHADGQGAPIGSQPEDSAILADPTSRSENAGPAATERRARIDEAIAVFGRALGSIMAHEAGHALGLVAEGKPAVGLFGGSEGEAYAHNLDVSGELPSQAWLMNPGRSLRFEQLAGTGTGGTLRFRPLNYAYLRDRVVLADPKARKVDRSQI